MVEGFLTPTHLLLILAVLALFFGARRLRSGRVPVRRWRGRPRLGRPTRRQAHVVWLVISLAIAFALTHGVAIPLFLAVFFVLWLAGFAVLVRHYR